MIGLSFSNMWICALLVFALQTSKRLASMGYIIGRMLTVIILAVIISFIGKVFIINSSIPQIISGIFILLLSSYIFLTQVLNIKIFPKKKHENQNLECKNSCDTCEIINLKNYKEYCDECRKQDAQCLALENGLNELSSITINSKKNRPDLFFGLMLGSLKGTIFCGKFLLIAPIMLSSSLIHSLSVGIIFSIASSLYPVLGFFFGSFALKFIKYRKAIFITSCIIMLFISIKYILNGIYS